MSEMNQQTSPPRGPITSINSDSELDAAIAVINGLLDRDSFFGDEESYLDALSDLVERYEAEHYPMPAGDGEDMP